MTDKKPDFNIDSYNIGELLDIFGITSPVGREGIMNIAANLIQKYRSLGQTEYVEFFSRGMNRLLSEYGIVENILGKVDGLLDEGGEVLEKVGGVLNQGSGLIEKADHFIYKGERTLGKVDNILDHGMGVVGKVGDLLDTGEGTLEKVDNILDEGSGVVRKVGHLIDDGGRTLDKVDGVLDQTRGTIGNINLLITEGGNAIEKVDGVVNKVGHFVDESTRTLQKVDGTLDEGRNVLGKVDHFIDEGGTTLRKVDGMLNQGRGVMGKVGHLMDEGGTTLRKVDGVLDESREVVDKVGNFIDEGGKALGKVNRMLDSVPESGSPQIGSLLNAGIGVVDKVDGFLDEAKEMQGKARELYERGRVQAQDFLNPRVQPVAPNIFKNLYYNTQTIAERAGPGVVMPARQDYVKVPPSGVGAHAPQLQNRLLLPNAYAQLPFAQGYINPTLQNFFITWTNVDSQYREIKPTGSNTASCPQFVGDPTFDICGNFYQNDSSTDFTFSLAAPVTNVMAMTVGSIEVPLGGYYGFSDKYGNTTFEITYDIELPESDPKKWKCWKIPEGNYDASGIKQIMDGIFNEYIVMLVFEALGGTPAVIPLALSVEGILQTFVDKSNQKIYFAFSGEQFPAPVNNIINTESKKLFALRWFGASKCGGCPVCTANIYTQEAIDASHNAIQQVRPNKEYRCSHKNTGKKVNSTLGWSLGFREAVTRFQEINVSINPVADEALLEHVGILPFAIPPVVSYIGAFGSCIWNELGTKYMILEVDDFNRNRNSGNMGAMSMPSCMEKFALPSYAKRLSQVYAVCDPSNAQQLPDAEPNPGKNQNHLTYSGTAPPLSGASYGNRTKAYYENFKRSCRKGTPAQLYGVRGQDTLTKAQKYTAIQITNTQQSNSVNQYFSPQASNILFRFPVQRLSTNLQAPMIIPNAAGMDNGRRYFGPVTIEKLRVRLLDDKGFPVDLHCGDISFSLILERLYQY